MTALSLLARDLLIQAQAQLEAQPALTLWLAAFHADHAPRPSLALDEIASLPAEQLELSGAEACDEITHLLQTSGYPDTAPTVPAPAPTVEAPAPDGDALILALGRLGEAWEHLEAARVGLGGHREGELFSLLQAAEALARDLGAEVETRVLGLGEAAELWTPSPPPSETAPTRSPGCGCSAAPTATPSTSRSAATASRSWSRSATTAARSGCCSR